MSMGSRIGSAHSSYETTALNSLSDVSITSPSDNDLLAYDSVSSAWINQTPNQAGLDSRYLQVSNNLSDLNNVATARTNLGLAIGSDVQAWDADLDTWATKTAPSGTVVGTSDTQTLTNKTLTSPDINGGTADSLTSLSIRSTGAAFDLTIATDTVFTAGRTLTIRPGDASRTLTLSGDATLSGTNTGDQTITLTGDVTGSGTGSFAATIANDAVTYAKIQNISASDRLLGRDTALAGDTEELTVGGGIEFTGTGGIQTSAFTGDVTKTAGGTALTIADDAVTYAKIQNVSATDKVLGRSSVGAGDVEEIACTSAGRALIDDADAATQRTTLGLVAGGAGDIWVEKAGDTMTGNLLAGTDSTYDLGSTSSAWANLYVDTISSITGNALNLTPIAGQNLNVNLSTTGDFAVNTNQLYVDTSAGNVGIGTTSPGTLDSAIKLEVGGGTAGSRLGSAVYHTDNTNAASHAYLMAVSGGASGGDPLVQLSIANVFDWSIGVDNSDSDKLKIGPDYRVGTSTALTIDTSGNVGIGTTGPSGNLHVVDSTTNTNADLIVQKTAGFDTTFPITNGAQYTGGPVLSISNQNASANSHSALLFDMGSGWGPMIAGRYISGSVGAPVTALDFYTSNGENLNHRMVIDNTGNVGIGTTGPGALLHLKTTSGDTTFRIDTGAADTDSRIEFFENAVDKWVIRNVGASSDILTIDSNSANNVFSITQAGNVGIGTASPGGRLDVDGAAQTVTAVTQRAIINNTNAITTNTGATAVYGLTIDEPNITVGTQTPTNSASLYISAAATEATNNYALWVDSGNVQIDDNLTVSGTITIPNGTTPTVDAAGEIAVDTDADGNLIDQGLIVYHDGVQKMFVVAVDTLPSTDNHALTYDAVNDKFVFEAQSGGGGSVATDTIWDAKGDLAVGTGADTASKLTIGSNGQTIVADSSQSTGILWLNYPDFLFQNALINGGFDVWQRNTTFTPNDDVYTADRWNLLTEANGAWIIARDTDVPSNVGFKYSAKFTNVTLNNQVAIVQIIENVDAIKLDDQVVSLSFYAKTTGTEIGNLRATILSWSSTADSVTSDVIGTWASDGTDPTWATNWTAEVAGANKALTASWQRFTIENVTIDTASMANIAVVIWVDDGTIAANDDFWITGVQLNVGSISLPYQPKSFEEERTQCMRFFEKSFEYVDAPADGNAADATWKWTLAYETNTTQGNCEFRVEKRVAPTITLYNERGGTAAIWHYFVGSAWSQATSTSTYAIQSNRFTVRLGTSGAFTADESYPVEGHWTADAEL